MREHRPPYRKLRPDQKRKSICRSYTKVLVQRGHLNRKPCARCGAVDVQAHHPDYRNPRLVV